MKLIITTILAIAYLIGLGVNASAQKGRVEVSPVIESKRVNGEFAGWSDKFYYEVSYSGRTFAANKVFLRKYDKKLNLVSESQITFNLEQVKSLSLEGITVFNGKLTVFSSHVEKSTKTQTFYYQHISSKDEASAPIKLIETDFDDDSKVSSRGISFKISPEQNYLMVYQSVPSKKGENEKLNAYVFDHDMKLFWKKSVELEYSAKNTSIAEYEVSDMGSAYMLVKVSNADKEVEEVAQKREKEKSAGVKKSKQTERTAFFIYTFSPGGDESQKYLIDLGKEVFATALKTSFSQDGTIAIGGFYADNSVTSGIQGTFYMTLDLLQKQMGQAKTQKIPEATRRLLLGNKAVDKGKDKNAGSFLIKYFKPQPDGSTLIVAEEYYITVHYNSSKGNIYFVHHYDDVLAMKLDAEGNVMWSNVVRKSQQSSFDPNGLSLGRTGFSFNPNFAQRTTHSINLRVVDDNVFIVYNDNIANLDVTKLRKNKSGDLIIKPFDPRGKSASILVRITPEGKLTREELMRRQDKMGILAPADLMSVDSENVLLGKAVSASKRIRLVRIHLK